MADYFTRLAERTLGVTPVAQADLPSMFAPVAPMGWSMETIATRQSARAERLTPESRFQPMAREDLPPAEAEQASETPREELVFRPSLVKFQLTAREASTGHLSVAAENDNSAGARATSAAAGELSIATSRPGKAQPPRVQHGQVSIHPERAEFPDSTSFTGTRFEATSPTIQVSIGRVEVRAVTAPAQPPRVVQRKAPPLLSLDQYLRERNGGKR